MILEKINSPADLRKLSFGELNTLSQEIRELIIDVVSLNGGHLASSLGAVEVCVSLHYCFNTPLDSIVFDVGHQSYAHKIITGRRDSFKSLRQYKGVSGFPNYQESEYDIYLSGHASTAISWAQGIAEAKRLKDDPSRTIAVVGDGSLTGGLCFEALNSCGHCQSDILLIVNHNEMSISPSVGALSKYLTKVISAPVYNKFKEELEGFLEHFSLMKKLVNQARKFEESMKGLMVPGAFFEELGFRYFGPIDGHNIEALTSTIKNISALSGPRVLHVITQKGKGYQFSEENPEDFHGISLFDKNTGQSKKEKQEDFSRAFANKLESLAQKNEKLVAITAAMPKGTGLCDFAKKYPKRFFDVGIAEEHAVSFASGLAKEGLKPVVAIYSTFLQRAFDQIIHDVALQKLNIVFAIDRAGVVGEDGPTHHGVFDIGYLRLIPNMICMAPKDKQEFEGMLEFSLEQNCPVSVRYPRGHAYSLNSEKPIVLGKAEEMIEGDDLCLLAIGSMVKTSLESANLLAQQGIKVGVVNARFIKPLDCELIRELVGKYKTIVTLEEGNLSCGFGSAILEFLEQENLLKEVRLIRAGFPDEFIPSATRHAIFNMYGLDPILLGEKIKEILELDLVK